MISNEQYHADVSRIGKSGLDLIAKSPAHYWARYLDPNRPPREVTAALQVGTAVHHAVLEPHEFERRYRVMPHIDRRSTAGKVQYQALQQEANRNRWTLLEQEDYDRCRRMRDAVLKHSTASVLVSSGVAETTVYFTEPNTGVACKCRPDFLSDTNFIVDIKTTEDASPAGFAKSVWNWRYHVQAPFYMDGLLYGQQQRYDGFVFVAIEKEPPYAIGVYFVPEPIMERGRETYLRDLQVYKECLRTNEWPAYSEMILPLQLPAWAR